MSFLLRLLTLTARGDTELETKLAASEASLKEVDVVVGRASAELEVEGYADARLQERVGAVIQGAKRSSVRSTFMVIASHYQDINFAALSAGLVPGFSDADLEALQVETRQHADALAAKLEKDALPKMKID